MNNNFEQTWNRIAEMLIPADAPAVQYRDMKNAFFLGAYAFMTSIPTDEVITEEQERMVGDMSMEIGDFIEGLMGTAH